MENNENQTNSTPIKSKINSFIEKITVPVVVLVIIATLYLLMNPEELSDGKKLAKEGDHKAAVSEFVNGINRYYDNNFTGRRTRAIKRLSYKMNLHKFFYNLGLSYQAVGDTDEYSAGYYAYALEAYGEVLLLKKNNKKAIEAKASLENKFEELVGEPYVYGSIFEFEEEESEPTTTMSDDEIIKQRMIAGGLLADAEQHEAAIMQYDIVIATDSKYLEAYTAKLEILYELKKYKEAKKCVKDILKLDPDNEIAKRYFF